MSRIYRGIPQYRASYSSEESRGKRAEQRNGGVAEGTPKEDAPDQVAMSHAIIN